jgi:succinylglutamate desuccinylase
VRSVQVQGAASSGGAVFFFSPHKDIIGHTLACADEPVQARHSTLTDGTEVTLLDCGVIRIEPNTASQLSLVISCGVHGNETAPIEIVSQLVSDLLSGEVSSAVRVLFILANPWAMAEGRRFVDINMNRLFCGQWQYEDLSLKEVKRAARLEAYVANFFAEEPVTVEQRLHYDCHTAIRASARERFAVYPFVPDRVLPEQQQALLTRADIETVLLQQEPANTFSSFTSVKQDAQSFTLELGKVMPFGANDLSRFSGIDLLLRALICGEELPNSPSGGMEQFVVHHTLEKSSENWTFHVPDDAPNFSEYAPGSLIAEDGGVQYLVGEEPEYVVFPNPRVKVGERAGLMLRKLSR